MVPLLVLLLIASSAVETTYQEQNFAFIRQQTESTDCGPASVLTLIHLVQGVPGTVTTLEDRYYSFAELITKLRTRDLAAAGYLLSWEHLSYYFAHHNTPMIVHYHYPEEHIVVATTIFGHHVLVADPRSGWQLLPEDQFRQQWSGYCIVLTETPAPIEAVTEMKMAAIDRLQSMLRWGQLQPLHP